MANSHTQPQRAQPSGAKSAQTSSERVLFITRKWGPAIGGMETYCERLTEELAKLGYVDVIALKGQPNGLPPSIMALALFPFTILRRLFVLKAKPGVIHLGDMAIWPLGIMALLFAPRAKLVLSAHGTDVSYGARGGIKGGLYNIYMSAGSWMLKSSRVIANSHVTKARLERIGWNCDAVVPLATDLRAQLQPEYNANELVFAGRLVKRKGLGWFVQEVLPLLPQEVRVTVIGTRWDPEEDRALEHPQVEFVGGMDQMNLAKRFAMAACVIIPNIEPDNGEYEGFGLVAPEAASAGGLVLASSSGGLTDAVQDGKTGFLIEAENAQEWANKIIEILNQSASKRAAFLKQSQRFAQDYYAWDRVARETQAAY